jgi:hypothetical protein
MKCITITFRLILRNTFYVGKTKINLKIRFKEHISEIKLKYPNSNFAKHVLENKITIIYILILIQTYKY